MYAGGVLCTELLLLIVLTIVGGIQLASARRPPLRADASPVVTTVTDNLEGNRWWSAYSFSSTQAPPATSRSRQSRRSGCRGARPARIGTFRSEVGALPGSVTLAGHQQPLEPLVLQLGERLPGIQVIPRLRTDQLLMLAHAYYLDLREAIGMWGGNRQTCHQVRDRSAVRLAGRLFSFEAPGFPQFHRYRGQRMRLYEAHLFGLEHDAASRDGQIQGALVHAYRLIWELLQPPAETLAAPPPFQTILGEFIRALHRSQEAVIWAWMATCECIDGLANTDGQTGDEWNGPDISGFNWYLGRVLCSLDPTHLADQEIPILANLPRQYAHKLEQNERTRRYQHVYRSDLSNASIIY